MITYLKGLITEKNPTFAVVEANGVGYKVMISLQTYTAIQSLAEGKLFTTHIVREDAELLYGFFEDRERSLFNLLIGVSGVGPSTAILALSAMTVSELESAIIQGNESIVKSIKGIGAKTAGRIILEIRDKISKTEEGHSEISMSSKNTLKEEALTALISLGFVRSVSEKAIQKSMSEAGNDQSLEMLIKSALKYL